MQCVITPIFFLLEFIIDFKLLVILCAFISNFFSYTLVLTACRHSQNWYSGVNNMFTLKNSSKPYFTNRLGKMPLSQSPQKKDWAVHDYRITI